MANITAANLAEALTEVYADGVDNMVYDAATRWLLSTVKKDTTFGGTTKRIPVRLEDSGGRSRTFSFSQTNVLGSNIVAWDLDVVADHGTARIDIEAIMRSRNNKSALLDGAVEVVDGLLNRMSNNLEQSLWSLNTGERGTIGGITSDVITLSDIEDVHKFHIGQELVFAASAAAALRDSGTSATVTALDPEDGQVTISATPTGVTTSDLIFEEGDYTAANDVLSVAGVPTWLTAAAATTTLFGLDRSTNTKLSGIRHAGSTSAVEDAIIDANAKVASFGNGKTDFAVTSNINFGTLTKELVNSVERAPGGKAEGGYQYITVWGQTGPIKVIGSRYVKDDVIYLMDMDSWELHSMEEPVRIWDGDGNKFQRVYNEAAVDCRVHSWVNLCCVSPYKNCRVALS